MTLAIEDKRHTIGPLAKVLQAISKKGLWLKIEAKTKLKPEAYSSIPKI